MADKEPIFSLAFNEEVILVVIVVGDLFPIKHQATGYKVINGFLLIMNGERVIASYNTDKWIAIKG